MDAGNDHPRRFWFALIASISILLIGTVIATAQATPTPITIGENQTGNIADATGNAQYSLSVAAPMSVEIQVLAISQGFAPTFAVLDPAGIVVLDAANPGTQTIARGMLNLSSPGSYTIEVSSSNGTAGQFLISVQPGSPLEPPQPLVLGESVNGSVNPQTTRRAYSFAASATDGLLVTVRSDDPASGVVVALRDAESGDTFGLSSAELGGVRYRILSGQTKYLLEIMHSGGADSEPFVVCLETESGSVTCSNSGVVFPATRSISPIQTEESAPPPAASPTTDPAGACSVSSASGVSINVRSGPGTGYGIVGNLLPNTSAPVIGRLADNSWFEVNVAGVIGWVSASVVTLSGNCDGIAVVAPPAPPPTQPAPPSVEFTPTYTLTPAPDSETPPSAPSLTPTVTNTPNPLLQLTAISVPVRPSRPDLTIDRLNAPIINQTTYLDVRVINSESASAGAFTVSACIAGYIDPNGFPTEFCQSQQVSSLGEDTGKILTFSVPHDIRGQHPVIATVDSTNVVAESNEANNTATATLDFH